MSLQPGQQLASYEITSVLGKGGMGEVYRARDTKLKRDVAIKILPVEFSRDSDRVLRFQREAEALAALNHQNIAGIYDLQQSGATRFLVMELVEGETLAERKARGPIPIDESLSIAKQIAEALEAAHEKGIIHRDLKPANVKITPDGKVKVLDFGLAKAYEAPSANANLSNSPTGTMAATNPGVILGTAAYMSPEQAKGKPSDVRSDIWSFGVVLYEMLTGRIAFEGESVVEVLGGVMKGEPDWNALPLDTPAQIKSLLRRCLQKDRNRRIHHIADARLEIEEGLSEPETSGRTVPTRKRERVLWIAALVALAVMIGLDEWMVDNQSYSSPRDVVRLSVMMAPGQQVSGEGPAAISPNGSVLAYVVGGQLYLRPIDSFEAKPVAGATPAQAPFFSPDGKWVGFFGQGKLKKVSVAGGSPEEITEAPAVRGAAWASDDTIYFSSSGVAGLRKVQAAGGMASDFTSLDRAQGEVSHRWPQVLPGGKALLFTVWKGPGFDERQLELLIFQTKERRVLARNAHAGIYSPSGHLVYANGGVLMAVSFDLDRLDVTGPPMELGILARETNEGSAFTLSASGSLAYVPGSPKALERQLAWVDRKGAVQILPAPIRAYGDLAISPDGSSVAILMLGANQNIWIYDFARNTMTPLTTAASSQYPIWTPDGKYVIYRGTRSGYRNLFRKAADGSGDEEPLTTMANIPIPGDVSRDGKFLVFSDGDPTASTGSDIWSMPLDGNRMPQMFLGTPAAETVPRFSPDGLWLSYSSNESGRSEVYVKPFPGPGQKILVSVAGGSDAQWAKDGRELFYRLGNKMMVVDVRTQPAFSAGSPRQVYEHRHGASSLAPDGRFLVVLPTEPEQPPTRIDVVLNWAEEIKNRLSAK